jgi:hypothetical protein
MTGCSPHPKKRRMGHQEQAMLDCSTPTTTHHVLNIFSTSNRIVLRTASCARIVLYVCCPLPLKFGHPHPRAPALLGCVFYRVFSLFLHSPTPCLPLYAYPVHQGLPNHPRFLLSGGHVLRHVFEHSHKDCMHLMMRLRTACSCETHWASLSPPGACHFEAPCCGQVTVSACSSSFLQPPPPLPPLHL